MIQEMYFTHPYLNAAGSLGFAPAGGWTFGHAQGAFVTHPISLNRRAPAANRQVISFSGGFLMHTGFPNPGLRSVLKHYAARWQRSSVPVWVHLIPGSPEETAEMIAALENVEGVMGIELGLPPEASDQAALQIISAAAGELPFSVTVPLDRTGEGWVKKLLLAGASALTLTAPRGALPGPDGKLAHGRLFGPALFPMTCEAVLRMTPLDLPVIAGAGIYSQEQAELLLRLGASAVQLDAVLWRGAVPGTLEDNPPDQASSQIVTGPSL